MKITKEGIAVIENDTHISKWVEEFGRLDHDQNMLPLVLPYINEGDTIIDCGAYIGDHTIAYLDKIGPKGYAIAIEPNPKAYECLVYNLSNYENCLTLDIGVSDEPGEFSIENMENAGASSLIPGGSIDVFSLDDFRVPRYLKRCDFIKMDIEGFELKALNGAKELITKFHPKLLIEINQGALEKQGCTPEDIFKFLREYGYKFHNIYKEQSLEGLQYDVICL